MRRSERFGAGLVAVAMVCSAVAFGLRVRSWNGLGDVGLFSRAGSTLMSANWLHTFHQSVLQAGPLELIVASLARSLGGGPTGFAVALDVLCWSAVTVTIGSLVRWRPIELAFFGSAACLLPLPGHGYRGHPAELFIGALWLLAAREARRDHAALAGICIGVAGCFEVWGILGVATLALLPRFRSALPGFGLALGLPLLCFLPFVVGGDFHMFDFRWLAVRAPASLIVGYRQPFTWPLRVGQGAIVVLVGLLAARKLRAIPESIWIVPALVMLVRIALDPVILPYYFDPALIALLLGAAQIITHPRVLAERLEGWLDRRALQLNRPSATISRLDGSG